MSHFKKRAILLSLLIVSSLFAFHFAPHTRAQAPAGSASILFDPETVSTNAGDSFTTAVWLDTNGASVGGVGAKITFDPAILSVEKIETQPVFPDYPATTFDNTTGKIVISGIVNNPNELYSGKAQFATISWKAKSGGNANITLDYTPNQTSDSNIAVLYGNGDILEKVNTVSVTVTGSAPATNTSDSTAVTTALQENQPAYVNNTNMILLSVIVIIGLVAAGVIGFLIYNKKKPVLKEEIPHIQTPQTPQTTLSTPPSPQPPKPLQPKQ